MTDHLDEMLGQFHNREEELINTLRMMQENNAGRRKSTGDIMSQGEANSVQSENSSITDFYGSEEHEHVENCSATKDSSIGKI